MIRITEVVTESAASGDLEEFWLEELEQVPNLSYRLFFLLQLREILPKKLFASLIKEVRFLKWIETFDNQMQKWEAGGRPPSAETVIAFMKLTMGVPYEDVLDQLVDEGLRKPTQFKTQYEANLELPLRKQAITKKVYRVKNSLEATGFSIKHAPKVSKQYAEFIEKIRLFATTKNNLENEKLKSQLTW